MGGSSTGTNLLVVWTVFNSAISLHAPPLRTQFETKIKRLYIQYSEIIQKVCHVQQPTEQGNQTTVLVYANLSNLVTTTNPIW